MEEELESKLEKEPMVIPPSSKSDFEDLLTLQLGISLDANVKLHSLGSDSSSILRLSFLSSAFPMKIV
ncbi:hypothetical protein TSUD_172990 [Trifolium subterraneum]|nr:hypothetical protein TSUD_172990 [Trifolium subterraneum]